MKIEELEDKTGVEVSGRGILHLSVLMETMRREGFEFQVGRPRVLFKKDENGNKIEPIEQAVVECPNEYSGKVVEVIGTSGGIMASMDTSGIVTHLEFKIPTRGIMGLKNRIINVPTARACSTTLPGVWPLRGRDRQPQERRYDLHDHRQGRRLRAGYAAGARPAVRRARRRVLRGHDRGRAQQGRRHGGEHRPDEEPGQPAFLDSDISVQLAPPRTFTLEEALEYIADDELVEITPKNIRLRKRLLNATDRKKAAVRAGQVNK